MIVQKSVHLPAFKTGGSGVQSFLKTQPQEMPTVLEAGTLNGHGIAGLHAALNYILNVGTEQIKRIECQDVYKRQSKISFPGSGIAAIAASDANLADIRNMMKVQTIGHDKVNQLRHVRFFKDIHGIVEHMKKHADIMRPKFETVINTLERELGGLEIGSWIAPRGGYFISFDAMEGCAKAIVAKAKEAGLVMTGACLLYTSGPKE